MADKILNENEVKANEIAYDDAAIVAEEKAKRTLDRADEQIELEKKQAINEVKDEVSRLAVDIASALIERDVSAEEHKGLIDEFIAEIGEAK